MVNKQSEHGFLLRLACGHRVPAEHRPAGPVHLECLQCASGVCSPGQNMRPGPYLRAVLDCTDLATGGNLGYDWSEK